MACCCLSLRPTRQTFLKTRRTELFEGLRCLFGNQPKSGGKDMAYARSRSITYAILFIWVSTTLSVAQQQATTPTSKPEDQLMQLERDWLTADGKGDAASLRRIIADDFIGSSFDGGLLSKEDIIPQGGGPGGFA